MSRSRKFLPISGTIAASSENSAKRWWNRSLRKAARGKISSMVDVDDVLLPFTVRKDGKRWFDIDLFPEILRK